MLDLLETGVTFRILLKKLLDQMVLGVFEPLEVGEGPTLSTVPQGQLHVMKTFEI